MRGTHLFPARASGLRQYHRPPLLDLMTIGASVISPQQVDASPGPGPPVTPDRGLWTCCVALGGPLNAPSTGPQCHAHRIADAQSPSSARTDDRSQAGQGGAPSRFLADALIKGTQESQDRPPVA